MQIKMEFPILLNVRLMNRQKIGQKLRGQMEMKLSPEASRIRNGMQIKMEFQILLNVRLMNRQKIGQKLRGQTGKQQKPKWRQLMKIQVFGRTELINF